MKAASVYSRAVRKAAEMVGGREELARTLQVPSAEVEKLILGEKKPTDPMVFGIADADTGNTQSGRA